MSKHFDYAVPDDGFKRLISAPAPTIELVTA